MNLDDILAKAKKEQDPETRKTFLEIHAMLQNMQKTHDDNISLMAKKIDTLAKIVDLYLLESVNSSQDARHKIGSL